MSKRSTLVVNVIIACILLSLSVVVFTTDLNSVFLTVSAPLQSGNRNNQNISLMFTVNGQTPYLEPILDILEEKGLQATFFVDGTWASANLGLLNRIKDEHEIGNGGKNITTTQQLLKNIMESPPTLFHPPDGRVTRQLLRVAEGLSLVTVLPSNNAPVRNGDLILLSPNQATMFALPQKIDDLLVNGFNLTKVSETIAP